MHRPITNSLRCSWPTCTIFEISLVWQNNVMYIAYSIAIKSVVLWLFISWKWVTRSGQFVRELNIVRLLLRYLHATIMLWLWRMSQSQLQYDFRTQWCRETKKTLNSRSIQIIELFTADCFRIMCVFLSSVRTAHNLRISHLCQSRMDNMFRWNIVQQLNIDSHFKNIRNVSFPFSAHAYCSKRTAAICLFDKQQIENLYSWLTSI